MHLGNYLLKPDTGVAQKTFAMAEAMRHMGRNVFLVAISDLPVPADLPPFLTVRSSPRSGYVEEAERFFASLHHTDKVLFRYPFASAGLLRLVNRFGGQIIFEHNTIEQAEMLLMQQEHFSRQPWTLKWSYFRYAIQTKWLKSTVESRLGPAILAKVLGGICVSEEIKRYEQGRYHKLKAVTIANGADSTVETGLVAAPLVEELVVTMLIGSEAIWHGYERLLAGLLAQTPTKRRIRIQLVGIDRPSKFSWPASNGHVVEWLGRKSKRDIQSILEGSHIAAGTLALYRKAMHEASPLKVRECLMMGLPMILGYFDTDVSSDERFNPFLFQVGNNETPIDWVAVESWYEGLHRDAGHRKTIAWLANEVLSMSAKASKYLEFIDHLSEH